MVVDAILERNPEVAFRNAVDMDKVSNQISIQIITFRTTCST